jgi:hypothetical protein
LSAVTPADAAAPFSPDLAGLADWVVRHGSLFGMDEAENRRAMAEAAPEWSRHAQLLAELPAAIRTAPGITESGGVDEHVLIRGNHRTPGPAAPRRLLEALGPQAEAPFRTASGRLELAEALTRPDNPLVARVMVNRVWQHLFGRGLCATVDNMGVMGEPPTHPELLDALADEFIHDGWSVKRLIRRMMTSRAYQLSSLGSGEADELDPDNRLVHRMNVKRLEAECLRDAILAVSGRIDPMLFGPSVEIHLTPFMEGRGRPQSGPLDGAGRRSIYVRVRRNFLSPFMTAFDFPTPFTTIGRRSVSNVPAQSLALMNSPFVRDEARRWAARVLAQPAPGASARISMLFERALCRLPTPEETAAAIAFLDQQAAEYSASKNDPRPWSDLCHVLLGIKEFYYIP